MKFSNKLMRLIANTCIELRSIDLSHTTLNFLEINYLVNNLSPKISKLSLKHQRNLRDEDVKALVSRCNNIEKLDLGMNGRKSASPMFSMEVVNLRRRRVSRLKSRLSLRSR